MELTFIFSTPCTARSPEIGHLKTLKTKSASFRSLIKILCSWPLPDMYFISVNKMGRKRIHANANPHL